MDEKLIFLGVGGDSRLTGKQDLGSGGIVLQTEGMQFHIDPGPGSLLRAKLYGVNVRETTAILVSHSHLSHCNDVNALISACSYAGMDKNAVLVASRSVCDGDDYGHAQLTLFHKECVERTIVADPGKRIGINRVEVQTTRTRHADQSALGFKFHTPRFVLGYSGDTEFFPELVDEFKGCDILLLNVKDPFDRKSPGNLNAQDAVNLAKAVKPNLLIITHYGLKLVQENPLHIAREIQKLSGIQTVAAKDGMIINPASHSHGKQPTVVEYR